MGKRLGEVYWAKSQKIDTFDTKKRRQYVVIKDNGKYVSVVKIRGFNENIRNEERLYELDIKKYPLAKRCGIDKKIYNQRVDNRKLLRLEDNEVFDKSLVFKLSSHDTHRAINHSCYNKQKKGKK